MDANLRTVLGSSSAVFGLLAFAWAYSRRMKPELDGALRLGMDIFVPALAFTSLLDSRLDPRAFAVAAGATGIQIATGLAAGALLLALTGWKERRELLLPIAFVNAANLPFPLLLANYGTDGLSIGVVCFAVTNLFVYTVGVLLLRSRGAGRSAWREPALWATVLACLLRAAGVRVPAPIMDAARIAAAAAVPLMLLLFGDSLARTRPAALRVALPAVAARYASGVAALGLSLWIFRPEALLRSVLILYALLPPAMINVVLVRNAGRDEQATAATVLIATVLGVAIIPAALAFAR